MNVAFIPIRGGSKSIPLKNIKLLGGKPLAYWTIKAACECKHINIVYVATDNKLIKDTVNHFKIDDEQLFKKMVVIDRSAESASDTASTETAMLEFASSYDFENIVLIQATSPLLTYDDLDRGFKVFSQKNTDSVLSVVRQKRFHWEVSKDNFAIPTNYDIFHRPRRQEFDGYFVENGAFYITSKFRLLKYKNRISGNIRIVEMSDDSFFEIDELTDWIIIEALMKKKYALTSMAGIPKIKMLLTDCDGCLTDSGMYYSEFGDELKKFNTRDGVGFELLKQNGIIVGIITGENLKLNQNRAKKLKLDIIENGCKDKLATVKTLCMQYGIDMKEVAYIGDDVNDLELINAVGYSCCPNDAMPQIKEAVKYIAQCKGGTGVIREIAEHICCHPDIIQKTI